jgi:hypothetical protein
VKNPESLVPFQGAVEIKLVLKNPLVGDDIGAHGARDKIPGVISDQGSKFFFHGTTPIWINNGGVDGGGHGDKVDAKVVDGVSLSAESQKPRFAHVVIG